jgi:hypothetical protein
MSETITPTEERVRLRIAPASRSGAAVRDILKRWLERSARRQGRHINEPSLSLSQEYDPASRQCFLYARADSFPDTLPDWLRTAVPQVRVKT